MEARTGIDNLRRMTGLVTSLEVFHSNPHCCRHATIAACVVCRFRGAGPGPDTRWQNLCLVLGEKLLVSNYAYCGHSSGYGAVLVGNHMPAYHAGNGTATSRRRGGLLRYFCLALARLDSVLSGTGMGIRSLLYGVWGTGCRQLVLGPPTTICCADGINDDSDYDACLSSRPVQRRAYACTAG